MKDLLSEFKKYSPTQHLVFLSMFHGIKKSMDIWIPDELLNTFLQFCDTYKVYHKCDTKFSPLKKWQSTKDDVIGWENLTTTNFQWVHIDDIRSWDVHVFLSMNPQDVGAVFQYGWYPIVTNNRVIQKTAQDLQDFGEALWYPTCCRKFFFERNNWKKYSFLYEIYRSSSYLDYRCNCLWKDCSWGQDYSYAYHMPCSFNCAETIRYASKVENMLDRYYPDISKECRHHLRLPCLVIREQKSYAFEWVFDETNQSISYTKHFNLSHQTESDMNKYIKMWNMIQIRDTHIINIYNKDSLVFAYDTRNSNEIEIPFFIQFQ